MGFDVKFFVVAKRKNSTFKPVDDTVKFTASCNLKESSGVLNPTISLSFTMESKPYNLNYAYIPLFKRYYYVTDWVYKDRLWWANLKVDVLASWKSTIETTPYYVLRCSAIKDDGISDTLYPVKGKPSRTIINGGYLWGTPESGWVNGTMIVGIVGQDGLTDYYTMGMGQFRHFAQAIFERCDWLKSDGGGLESFGDDVIKAVVNPAQYITSVMWLPPGMSPKGSEVTGINLGWWGLDLPKTAYKVDDSKLNIKTIESVTPTNHTQYSTYGEYMNNYPFRKILLRVPAFGDIWLDSSKIRSGEELKLVVDFDYRTGLAFLSVNININGAIMTLASRYAQIGVPLQVSDLKTDVMGAIGNTIGAVGSQLSGNYLGVGLGVGSALVDAIAPEVETMGSIGSTCNIGGNITCVVFSYEQPQHDNAHNGSPLCKTVTMKETGTGYYIVSDGNTGLNNAYSDEINEVKSLLESGVYYA